jgi:hypothetical protein
MLPPNTVPITAEELQGLFNKKIDLLVWIKVNNDWGTCCLTSDFLYDYLFNELEAEGLAIAAHDYRHYFGEVVDLASKMEGKDRLYYLGHRLALEFTEYGYGQVRLLGDSIPLVKGKETACKQWLIDHFTELIKKDLPHTNIKFIFS